MGTLRLLNALKGSEVNEPRPHQKELMFVNIQLKGKRTQALVDTRATHNFIAEEEAKRIGLKWEKDSSWVKVVNSVALPLFGVAKDVELLIGE